MLGEGVEDEGHHEKDEEVGEVEPTDPGLEEISREPTPEPQEIQIPIKVNVDTPSCSITVTTTGVQTRSQTRRQEDLNKSLPPVEIEKPKEKVSKWLGGVPKPAPRQEPVMPNPETQRTTRSGRTVKKPSIFDPSEEDRKQKEMRAKSKQAASKKGSGEGPLPTAQEQQQSKSDPKPGPSAKTGAIPKSRARSSKR